MVSVLDCYSRTIGRRGGGVHLDRRCIHRLTVLVQCLPAIKKINVVSKQVAAVDYYGRLLHIICPVGGRSVAGSNYIISIAGCIRRYLGCYRTAINGDTCRLCRVGRGYITSTYSRRCTIVRLRRYYASINDNISAGASLSSTNCGGCASRSKVCCYRTAINRNAACSLRDVAANRSRAAIAAGC